VDIDARAVKTARANIALKGASNATIFEGDVLSDASWLHRVDIPQGGWDVVAANLPYLPAPDSAALVREVNGGERGCALVPDAVFDIAEKLRARRAVLNISSLCDIDEICKRINRRGYKVTRVVAALAELEQYALKVLPYLKEHWRRREGDDKFVRLYQSRDELRQIILSVELETDHGAPFELMFEELERILRPEVDPTRRQVVVGKSSWGTRQP